MAYKGAEAEPHEVVDEAGQEETKEGSKVILQEIAVDVDDIEGHAGESSLEGKEDKCVEEVRASE